MGMKLFLGLSASALLAASIAEAAPGDRLRERIRARMAERMGAGDAQVPKLAPAMTFTYGSDQAQVGDLWFPEGHINDHSVPLVLFVHGGGWKRGSKDSAASRYAPAHFTGLGYVYAAIDYRLVPGAKVEDQAADVARAVKALLDQSKKLGIDRSGVVLTGHSISSGGDKPSESFSFTYEEIVMTYHTPPKIGKNKAGSPVVQKYSVIANAKI